jgi:transcriptional regulator with XRE-family HTH domain
MTKVRAMHRRWRTEHGDAETSGEFELARVLIQARTRAGLTQMELAQRMKTSQSYVARIEGGKVRPSTDALERFAQATGTRLRITFEPA